MYPKTSAVVRRQLHAAMRRYGIVASPAAGLLAENEDGLIVYYDSNAKRIFGYSRHDIIGQPSHMLVPRQGEIPEAAAIGAQRKALFENVLEKKIPQNVQTKRRDKSGKIFDVHAVVFPYEPAHGKSCIAALVEKS